MPSSRTGSTPVVPTVDMFAPVHVGRVSQVIVDQVRSLVRRGQLTSGDRLPSERALCERFGVSRVTVREALRMLEASGLVEIKVGAHGGAFITSPTREQLGDGFADLLTLSPLSAVHVTEARQVFELGILPMVVERATEADVASLYALCDAADAALKADEYSMAMSAEFHVRVAACTHNPAIEFIVQSFHGPLLMSLQEAQAAAPLMGRRGVTEHRKYVEAIEARDVAEAEKIMSRHLHRTEARVRELE